MIYIIDLIKKYKIDELKKLHYQGNLKNMMLYEQIRWSRILYIVDEFVSKKKYEIVDFLLSNGYHGTNKAFEQILRLNEFDLAKKFIKTGHKICNKYFISIIRNLSLELFFLIWINRRDIIVDAWFEDAKCIKNLFRSIIKYKKYDLFDALLNLGYEISICHYEQIIKSNDKELLNRLADMNIEITDKIFPLIIPNKDLEYIKKLDGINNYSKNTYENAIKQAIKYNRLDVVTYFYEKCHTISEYIVDYVIKSKNMDIFNFFIENGLELLPEHVKTSIRCGNLEVLKILEKKGFKFTDSVSKTEKSKRFKRGQYYRYNHNLSRDALYHAIQSKNMEMMYYILESDKYKYGNFNKWPHYKIIDNLISNNKINILQKFVKNKKIDKSVMIKCVKKNSISSLKIFVDMNYRFSKGDTFRAVNICILNKYYNMLCYLFDIGIRFTTEHLNYALQTKNSKIIDYILSKGSEYDGKSLINIIRTNNLDRLKHVVKDGKISLKLTLRFVSLALKEQKYEIVDYLLNLDLGLNVTSSCLDTAIRYCTIKYCKKLIEQGAKPSKQSMDYALDSKKNLAFLKYLKKNGGNFTSKGINIAIKNGNKKIIDYLLSIKTINQCFTSDAILYAVKVQDISLVKELYQICCDEWNHLTDTQKKDKDKLDRFNDAGLMLESVKKNNIELLRFLKKIDLIMYPDLIDCASGLGYLDIVKYLLSVNAPYSTDSVDWILKQNPSNGKEILTLLWTNHQLYKKNTNFCTCDGIKDGLIKNNKNEEIIKFIFDKGISIPVDAMELVVNRFDLEFIKYIHNPSCIQNNDCVIERAVKSNTLETVKFLIDNGYTVSSLSDLLSAVWDDTKYEMLQYIVNNSQINFEDDYPRNYCLLRLICNKAIKVLALLMQHGIQIDKKLVANKQLKKILFDPNADYVKIQKKSNLLKKRELRTIIKNNNKTKNILPVKQSEYNIIDKVINKEIALIGYLD